MTGKYSYNIFPIFLLQKKPAYSIIWYNIYELEIFNQCFAEYSSKTEISYIFSATVLWRPG